MFIAGIESLHVFLFINLLVVAYLLNSPIKDEMSTMNNSKLTAKICCKQTFKSKVSVYISYYKRNIIHFNYSLRLAEHCQYFKG